MIEARALWIDGPRRATLRTESLAAPAEGDALVRSLFGAISRGTEALVAAGQVPPSEFDRMRAPFQGGSFFFPVKYGYAVVGEVEEGPADLLGRTVFCLHPHQDRFRVPATALRPVPEDVPAARAVLAANMETALNIVWDAGVQPGDRVAVIGGGVVGLLAGWLAARIPATEVVLVDTDPLRGGPAAALGLAFAGPDTALRDVDICIHASGNPAGLATAIDLAGFEARIVEASWYGMRQAPLPLGGAFHARRLAIVSSQVGHLPPERRARWTYARRLDIALALLADSELDVLFTGETAFPGLASAYLAILGESRTLCHRIRYQEDM